MFGRKGLNRGTGSAPAPTPAPTSAQRSDDGVDAALSILSNALGVNLDFDFAYIFSPVLWGDPMIGALLSKAGLEAEMKGNKLALLKDAQAVARFASMGPDDPMRSVLQESGFGLVLYNPQASNRYNDGLTQMQMTELRKIDASPASDEAKKYATFNLMMFSEDVMKGKIKLG